MGRCPTGGGGDWRAHVQACVFIQPQPATGVLLIQLAANSWPNYDGMYCSSPGNTRAQLLGSGVVRAHGLHLGTGLIRELVPATLGWAGDVSVAGRRCEGLAKKVVG